MGTLSVATTQVTYDDVWPSWFADKYASAIQGDRVSFGPMKVYRSIEFFSDLQRANVERGWWAKWPVERPLRVVVMHECGGVARVNIYHDRIDYLVPEPQTEWVPDDCGIGLHYLCGGPCANGAAA